MLTRLYVENYKSLEAFEWRPTSGVSVLVGANGSGKSTIGAVLQTLKLFLYDGAGVRELFSDATRTRWRPERFAQRFELELSSSHGVFTYSLHVGFDSQSRSPWIAEERVELDGRVLYDFDGTSGRLHAASSVVPIPFSNQRSYLAIVDERTAATTLLGFPKLLSRFLVARLDPARMSAFSSARLESESLVFDGANFSSWYRWFASQMPEKQHAYFESIKGPLPGLVVLKSREAGEQRELRALFGVGDSTVEYSLDELSDGQRQLLALYLLLQRLERDSVVFLDEPDNYLSIREIQPWLAELDRVAEETGAQVFVVSHQGEAMDYLASRSAFMFTRSDGRATKVAALDDAALPSEVVLYGVQQ